MLLIQKYSSHVVCKQVVHVLQMNLTSFFIYLGYVDNMRTLLFSLSPQEMKTTRDGFKVNIPEPLNRQFTNRASRLDALKKYEERKEKVTILYPEGSLKLINTFHLQGYN